MHDSMPLEVATRVGVRLYAGPGQDRGQYRAVCQAYSSL